MIFIRQILTWRKVLYICEDVGLLLEKREEVKADNLLDAIHSYTSWRFE
jgi:hypothetical protein